MQAVVVNSIVKRQVTLYTLTMDYEKIINKKLENETKLLKIGQLATKTNTPISTIRFWTQEELLNIATTTASGYWLFQPAAVARVEKIKKLQQKRFTIREIKQMLLDDGV